MRACSGALAAVLLLATVGCSGSVRREDTRSATEVVTGLTVSGQPGAAPVVRMRTPLKVEETTSSVTVEGAGAPILVDQLFVIELSIFDARTGERAVSRLPLAAKSSDDQLFPKLSEALVGVRQGSRLVLAATAADAFATSGAPPEGVQRQDPVVVVADVLAVPPTEVLTRPEGLTAAFVPGRPEVSSPGGTPSTVNFDQAGPEPSRAQRFLVIGGSGPRVAARGLVTVHYLGQGWGQSTPFESTFFKEPEVVAIGAGRAPAGWDQQLVGVRRGSRVLMVVPGGSAPGDRGTIVWVVDVLGVS